MVTPSATMYDVNTQVTWSEVAPSAPVMCGRLTLTMVMSRMTIKVASMTAIVVGHGDEV